MDALAEWSSLTTADILEMVSLEEAIRVHKDTWAIAPPNALEPWEGEIPPVGTWRFSELTGFEVLADLPLRQVDPGEPEGMIKRWRGYPLYVRWAREGRQPPPIQVVRQARTRKLVSLDRRRVLAAKDAGRDAILAWFSETDSIGLPAWRLRKCTFCSRYEHEVEGWSRRYALVCGDCEHTI